ncbi:transmembrane 220 family protein [Granulosicoccus sp.]|nr:transmembrane 220 family protein [Granulosicoccus sp.]
MRYLYIALCLLMLLFIAVQYNDPDGPMWMAIYSVPAIWAALAAFKRHLLRLTLPTMLLLVSIACAIGGTLYYWPDSPHWWSVKVWMEAETAREGMGMMIISVVLLLIWLSTRRVPAPPDS